MKLSLALACSLLAGCVVGDEADDDDDLVDTSSPDGVSAHALTAGINGNDCTASPFNCKFHDGDSRVTTASGSETWAIAPGASVRDGNGTALILEAGHSMTFNFGQTRSLAGKAHALALSTSNGSAGWYPIDHITAEQSFRDRVGEVNAKDPGEASMACYEVRDSSNASLEPKKVVHDSQVGPDGHERAGDYLALLRADGRRSANMVFSVPGFALGGATTDHWLAGTRFRRVTVPTTSGKPSISIPLWVRDGHGDYKQRSGTMRFLYGYVRASDGVKRFGWMAQDALVAASGCN